MIDEEKWEVQDEEKLNQLRKHNQIQDLIVSISA